MICPANPLGEERVLQQPLLLQKRTNPAPASTQLEQCQHAFLTGRISKSGDQVLVMVWTWHHQQLVLLKSQGPGACRRRRRNGRDTRDYPQRTTGVLLLQSQNHIATGREQRCIAFTEQDHGMATFHLGRKGRRRLMPCMAPGFGGLHHRKNQGESTLFRTDPWLCDRSGHALRPITHSWKCDNLSLLDGVDRRQSDQLRISGTNTDQGEAGGQSGVNDGQRRAPSRIRSMSRLSIFPDQSDAVRGETAHPHCVCNDPDSIQQELRARGIVFEQWATCRSLPRGAGQAEILDAYADEINRIQSAEGYVTVDAIRMHPEHPERTALRSKFLAEHIHSDNEVRFFVEGQGLFCLHINEEVLLVLCEQGDLIHVPAGTRHWFDMGSKPSFCALRFFNNNEGWVARFTGSPIADRYPRLD